MLDALGIAVVGKDGYEADDVIGTLASTAPMPVDVVTGDRDLFQLVDDERRRPRALHRPRRRQARDASTMPGCRRSTSIPARGYVDYATLRGDASDGLPGVAGIGEKTAASCSTATAIWRASSPRPAARHSKISSSIRSKLGAAIDYLAVAPTVVGGGPRSRSRGRLRTSSGCPPPRRSPELFAELTELLGLGSSADRVLASLAGAAG